MILLAPRVHNKRPSHTWLFIHVDPSQLRPGLRGCSFANSSTHQVGTKLPTSKVGIMIARLNCKHKLPPVSGLQMKLFPAVLSAVMAATNADPAHKLEWWGHAW